MVKAPYSNIFVGSERTVAISASKICVYRTVYVQNYTFSNHLLFIPLYRTGELVHESDSDNTISALLSKSGPIRCAAISKSFSHLATIGDDKQVRIWEVDGLKALNARYVYYTFVTSERH